MENNVVFNLSVCLMGVLILSIHTVNLLLKKGKRKDERILLDFFLFTILHFATYLIFTLIKIRYTSNAFIIAFYTIFYMMNNAELFLLFRYAREYIGWERKKGRVLEILNLSLFLLFVLSDLVNAFTGIYFTAENGIYLRSRMMILSQGYQFVMFTVVFFVAVTDRKLNLRERLAFAMYCVLPFGAIILQNIFKGYAIAYLSIIIAIEVLFFFVNIQKNIDLAKKEEKNKDAQIKLMLSQIRPHFVYNSLSAISTLIPLAPDKAQTALDDFTEYLRHNLASLTESRLIPFEDELRHVETYVALEKLRFGERIKVNFDVQTTDFFVPPLSIQPVVENAIKHGILKKLEGGTLTLKTYQTETAFIVEVTDDGVGFRPDEVAPSGGGHFGINNIKYRIEKTCNGEMTIDSEEGQGARVTVVFRKEGR